MYIYICVCVCVKVQRFSDVDSLFHVYDEVKRSHAHTHICIVYMFTYNKEAHTLHVIHNKHIHTHTYIHMLQLYR